VVNDNAHLGLLYFSKAIFATQPRLRNFHANAFSYMWSLPWLWLADD
jgi:hypothetical protein